MNLDQAHEILGWPSPADVTKPKGGGPSVLAENVAAKIGRNLVPVGEEIGPVAIRTGVLFANPNTERTEAPVAIVCEFSRHVNEETLLEAHRLAWNFASSPVLITLEPTRVLAWSCNVRPARQINASLEDNISSRLVAYDIKRAEDPLRKSDVFPGLEQEARQALFWINLLAGSHFVSHPKLFKASERLDATLVSNLLSVRNLLRDQHKLPEPRCHDLLARLIFIQFLFQRKDSEGRPALHSEKLKKLANSGILQNQHSGLESLLTDYEDAYSLFRWLNEHFNGDLFPGKAGTPEDRDREWAEEKAEVSKEHLMLLSEFVGGKTDLSSGQGLLWQHYSFDTIPLELISSIYEVFVGPPDVHKSYYTSSHVVDFMLDAVLPWNGIGSDLKVLDPSCGSGIFLVKAFQRLIHRWKIENETDPKPGDLKRILQGQIFGVDINKEAVRVASFSLYLAMCDALDPRQYWSLEKLFPVLRDRNLIGLDFFTDDVAPFRSADDSQSFDLVIGNAPWGKGSSKKGSSNGVVLWSKKNGWTIPGKDIGPVFLAKAAKLVKPTGWVSMIQPAGILLNRSGPTSKFRRKMLSSFSFDEVINLAAVRRVIFANAIGPACVVTFQSKSPSPKHSFAYVTPKPQGTAEDGVKVVIEPHDVHFVSQLEAEHNDIVWSALMWGGQRDLELIRRLVKWESVENLRAKKAIATREGFIRGKGKQVSAPEIVGRHFLWEKSFPSTPFEKLKASNLDVNTDPMVHRRDKDRLLAFSSPQLLFKQAWRSEKNRFEAVLVEPDENGVGALCSDSYVSVHDLRGETQMLNGLWLLLNSSFAPYWFALAAGQFSGFIPKATEVELRQMPALSLSSTELAQISEKGYKEIDKEIVKRLGLSSSEKLLLEDLHGVVLPDAQRLKGVPPGQHQVSKVQLENYAETFLKVLHSTFGDDQRFDVTVFDKGKNSGIPASLVAIHPATSTGNEVHHKVISDPDLAAQLNKCSSLFFKPNSKQISFQRVIEVLGNLNDKSGRETPVLYLVRPSQRRYWLRSLALRDADRLGAMIRKLTITAKKR